jgi:hypothetical protein
VIRGQKNGWGKGDGDLDGLAASGPSPWVTLFGALLIPSTTVFRTEKLGLRRVAWNVSVPWLPSRVAVPISTSPGELTRVGTAGVLKVGGPEVRPTSESLEKTVIDFDLNVADIRQGRSRGDQPDNRGPSEARGLGQKEVISGLGLELSRIGRLGQRP